ncbi:MAG TPA: MG2 domain-containing protein, partial [Planctomycetota bacterium]|nr:MG2 domain-containing protein [Planctomycetota bacterium]
MSLRRFGPAVVLVAVLASSLIAVRGAFDADEQALSEARESLASARPAEALDALARVGGDPARDAVAKEAAVLAVLARLRTGAPEVAATAALRLLELWPADEPRRGRVEGLLADAAAARGDVMEAARVEGALAERLTSDAERARRAGVYFAWGDVLARPAPSKDPLKPADAPQPALAAHAYGLGLAALGAEIDAPERRLRLARCALDAGDPAGAAAAAREALRRRPGPPAPSDTRPAPPTPHWVVEAYALLGEAESSAGRHAEARAALRAALALPSHEETDAAARAWILLARSYGAEEDPDVLTSMEEAVRALAALRPEHAELPQVRFEAAAANFRAGREAEGIAHLDALVAIPNAPVERLAAARLARAQALRRLERLADAEAALREFLAEHPSDAGAPEAQRLLPQLLLDAAEVALRDRKVDDALAAHREFVRLWPLDARAPAVSLESGRLLRSFGRFAEARDAFRDARARWIKDAENAALEAWLLQGKVEEEDLRDVAAAAAVFRELSAYGRTSQGREARARLARLEAVRLALAAPRPFAPGEDAHVELTVRNVKEVVVRVYRLDAAGYFERKGTLAGAQKLDVALVKADRSFVHATPAYEPYREDVVKAPVRLGEAPLAEGAYLVTAEAAERRAAAVVLVSRLRMAVKLAPTEVFAWATDALTGAPIEGAEVLVRGDGLKLSARTEADGTARLELPKGAATVETFGRFGASAAPGESASAIAPTSTVSPRAHWAFDRPLYRPGETVRFALTARLADRGRLVTPDGETVHVAWIDPRGRVAGEAELKTERFGRADGAFPIPEDGAVGTWMLRAELRRGAADATWFERRVEVREFTTPEVRVTV